MQARGLAKPTVTIRESRVKWQRVTVNSIDEKKKTGTISVLKSDFDHEHLKYVQLAMSPSVPIVAMAVPAQRNGSIINVFLDTGVAASVINLQTLRLLHKA